MLLSDLFEQLSAGELSRFEMGGADNIGITKKNYYRVVPHINLALTELHKRFLIKEDEANIQCYDHIEVYVLNKKFAATNTESTETYKYINDTIFKPFKDNVLKIEKVFNEDGQELHLNERDHYIHEVSELNTKSYRSWTVNTPTYNSIQIPYPMGENALSVIYRANHEKILLAGLKPNTTEIDIPLHLLEPLLLYIAARVYSNLGGDSSQEGMAYMARFEASCRKIEEIGLINKDNAINQKLEVNGWV